MENFREVQTDIHRNAVEHGWWEQPTRTFGEIIALCHSELSEALEEYRNGRPSAYWWKDGVEFSTDFHPEHYDGEKPEGIGIELADCVIRIMDYCEYAGIDLWEAIQIKHEFNKDRPYKHGGKVI